MFCADSRILLWRSVLQSFRALLVLTQSHIKAEPDLVRGDGRVLGAHNVDGVMLVGAGQAVHVDDVVGVGDLKSDNKGLKIKMV